MSELSIILLQFIFRLCFGVAAAMAITPSRLVTSGFYRVHLWMLMGFAVFAALIAYLQAEHVENFRLVLGESLAIALLAYGGAILWLYEKPKAGAFMLYVIGGISLAAAISASDWPAQYSPQQTLLGLLGVVSAGLLLGATLTAMLLGHWYLNTPTMQLAPLRTLIGLMVGAIVVRAILCAIGLIAASSEPLPQSAWLFLSLRWLSGIVGTTVMAVMAWQTLKIPNTQSATGILYAAVILAFIGELTSQLLSVDTLYPV